ncbi:MAG: hypothetical protein RLZZ399_1568 [Verrucomicrobiota bacterium]|jgi:predicted DCC family thiol-disulfide oxidoreductase YuxK
MNEHRSQTRHFILYDSECALCTFQRNALSWLDWQNRFDWVPISDSRASQMAPHLSREALSEAIHCITRDSQIHRGARAIRFIGFHLPVLLPLSLLLCIPGVILIAELVYQWISKNRHLLGRIFGCRDACSILPQKERRSDSPPGQVL